MKPKIFFVLLSFLILNSSFLIGTVRYVSKTGTSTLPYTSWQTAADSIQKCIKICSVGDTIYVANGIYKEQVVMIPGLSLIGAGMDSCVVDTRDFIFTTGGISIKVSDSCLLKGFLIIVANSPEFGRGISGSGGSNTLITLNRITNAKYGIFTGGDITIYKNNCDNISSGIYVFNSNSLVRKNIVNTNIQSAVVAAIRIEAYNNNYHPIIDSNYIETIGRGIDQSIGARPTIINNNIITRIDWEAISVGYSDSANVINNLIISLIRSTSIDNTGIQYLKLYNNYVTGNVGTGIIAGPDNVVKNNVVNNANIGCKKWYNQPDPLLKYNNIWNTITKYSGFLPDTTNVSVDPMVVNDDSTQGELDFHLQKYSPLIDAGDPLMIDKDSSRIDIGLYGGLYGEVYKYYDLAPRQPRNLTAVVDTNYILLKWNRNTEADTAYYQVYCDTVSNFTPDSTKLMSSPSDTFLVQSIPAKVGKYYYKITCVDNQGNESSPSEELLVDITSVTMDDYPMTINDYLLYQNYPNPFNPSTKISYKLKERGYVKLYVYDIKGELVSVLVNKEQNVGFYEVEFSSSSIQNQGSRIKELASGVYIYQLMVRGENNIPVYSDIKKMIYLK